MRNLLLLLYIIINVFLLILNFELFSSVVDVDLGFSTMALMPIILIQLLGFLFVITFFYLDKIRESNKRNAIERLSDKNTIQEKELEIANLKLENSAVSNAAQPTEVEVEEVKDTE
jgi:ATP/ADP translocase